MAAAAANRCAACGSWRQARSCDARVRTPHHLASYGLLPLIVCTQTLGELASAWRRLSPDSVRLAGWYRFLTIESIYTYPSKDARHARSQRAHLLLSAKTHSHRYHRSITHSPRVRSLTTLTRHSYPHTALHPNGYVSLAQGT